LVLISLDVALVVLIVIFESKFFESLSDCLHAFFDFPIAKESHLIQYFVLSYLFTLSLNAIHLQDQFLTLLRELLFHYCVSLLFFTKDGVSARLTLKLLGKVFVLIVILGDHSWFLRF